MKVFSRHKKYRINIDLDFVATVSTKHGDFHTLRAARLLTYKMLSKRFKRIKE